MKKVILVFLFGIITHQSKAQLDSLTFDFWVGKWAATWQNSKGETETGTNLIEKILDERVLQEHFEILSGGNKGFKGTSISVWNSRNKTYHQAWADNQGGYFNFTGEVDGDKKIFKTSPRASGDQTIIQRMVFYDIKENSFTWDWESSTDNGDTWSLNWRINYSRSN
jgi:hypothetical protein